MSQSADMKKALLKYVVPNLQDNGFVGEYPHYRRFYSDRIEIISFSAYKYGNAFYVDVSTAYLREDNNNHTGFNGNIDEIVTGNCNKIYRLKGNFDGLFFYTDVYFKGGIYMGVSDKKAETYKKGFFDIRVQKADSDIYKKVCDRVNKQMNKAYKWWSKMSKK